MGNGTATSQTTTAKGRTYATTTSVLKTSVIVSLLAVGWWLVYLHLQPAAAWLTGSVFHLDRTAHLGSSVEFFLFEVPKVLMLLIIVVFGVGIIRSFFTPERTRAFLAGKRESLGNVMAASLGVVTPFCSC